MTFSASPVPKDAPHWSSASDLEIAYFKHTIKHNTLVDCCPKN